MRHIAVSESELRQQTEALCPGWLKRAGARAKAFSKRGCYAERTSIWSEVKPVFMTLQHNKCAFCERLLEGGRLGTIEHDMEHFRPKGPVVEWPTPEIAQRRKLRYRFSTGGGHVQGYYCLAYTLLNLVTACKPCNTMLKGSFFPISGQRCGGASPAVIDYSAEEPLLIYPLGDVDERPESLLTFDGVTPIPTAARGARRRRAIVTIDFFELDTRPELLRGRAELLTHLYLVREFEARSPVAVKSRRVLLSHKSAHSNCSRAFDALYDRDRTRATRMYDKACEYLSE